MVERSEGTEKSIVILSSYCSNSPEYWWLWGIHFKCTSFSFSLAMEFGNWFLFRFRFGKYLHGIILCILLVTQFCFISLSLVLFKIINSFRFFSSNSLFCCSMLLKQHSFHQIIYICFSSSFCIRVWMYRISWEGENSISFFVGFVSSKQFVGKKMKSFFSTCLLLIQTLT